MMCASESLHPAPAVTNCTHIRSSFGSTRRSCPQIQGSRPERPFVGSRARTVSVFDLLARVYAADAGVGASHARPLGSTSAGRPPGRPRTGLRARGACISASRVAGQASQKSPHARPPTRTRPPLCEGEDSVRPRRLSARVRAQTTMPLRLTWRHRARPRCGPRNRASRRRAQSPLARASARGIPPTWA